MTTKRKTEAQLAIEQAARKGLIGGDKNLYVLPDGTGLEFGPSGPEVHATEHTAGADLFVVVSAANKVLFRAGTYIPEQYTGLPTVAAIWVNGVLVPGS